MTPRIDEIRQLRHDVERVAAAIGRDPEPLFGTAAGASGRFHAELVVELGRGASVHQVVALHVGPPECVPGRVEYALRWEPVGHHRLLPEFAGRLAIIEEDGSSVLRISGHYRAPFGPVGVVGDAVGGRRLARRSVADFVDVMTGRINRAVDDDLRQQWRPAPAMADLRPTASENWLG